MEKIRNQMVDVRLCNSITSGCRHGDDTLWTNEDHVYKSYIFDHIDLCEDCYQETVKFSDKSYGADRKEDSKPEDVLDSEMLSEMEVSCVYENMAEEDDWKYCMPLSFKNHLDDQGEVIGKDGWYWSKQTRSHCCIYHYNKIIAPIKSGEEKIDHQRSTLAQQLHYEKIDKTTFHKFLFRLDFSTDILVKSGGNVPNREFDPCFLILPPSPPTVLEANLNIDKFSSSTKDKIIRNLNLMQEKNVGKKLFENLAYINAGNDYLITPTFHPDFGSLYSWVPFDEDVNHDYHYEEGIVINIPKLNSYRGKRVKQKILNRYALVYCDKENKDNKELFGQVATAVLTQSSEKDKNHKTFLDMTYMNVDDYLARKYSLDEVLTKTLDPILLLPIINIIIQYSSYEKNNFIKNLRQSAGFKL
jgi:hypothetical protein